jgi:hypothetical protein
MSRYHQGLVPEQPPLIAITFESGNLQITICPPAEMEGPLPAELAPPEPTFDEEPEPDELCPLSALELVLEEDASTTLVMTETVNTSVTIPASDITVTFFIFNVVYLSLIYISRVLSIINDNSITEIYKKKLRYPCFLAFYAMLHATTIIYI